MSSRPKPEPVGPNMESVWDYPRPPLLESSYKTIRVVFGGETIIETTNAKRVLETSHPPTYYLPIAEVKSGTLVKTARQSWCEWKGPAVYFSVCAVGGVVVQDAAWGYEQTTEAFADLVGHVAFYAQKMDACFVDDEEIVPQPGGFYGGWITKDLAGPFKGVPGSMGW